MNELIAELKPILVDYGVQIIVAVAVALLGAALKWLKALIIENIKNESVGQAVRYVEQIYRGVSSSKKYEEALQCVSEKLSAYGLEIDEAELKVKIEAYVNEFFAHSNYGAETLMSAEVSD